METRTATKPFQFKKFSIEQDRCTMKVGTDGMLLGAWSDIHAVDHALDIGTGTGLIAIMLAQRCPNAVIHAVEIDKDACSQATENMLRTPWASRLHAFNISIQDFSEKNKIQYDLIVSNPPFFSGGTFSSSQDKNSVRHTIKLPHGDLLSAVRSMLHENGKFCVILPHLEGLRFKEMAAGYHLYCTKITEVKPRTNKHIERLLLQFERKPGKLAKDCLVILNEGDGNDWTDAYKKLTSDFYLNG